MHTAETILLDADFLIALNVKEQSTHQKAQQLALQFTNKSLVMLRIVQAEFATVASRKFDHDFAVEVSLSLEDYGVSVLEMTTDDYKQAWEEFANYTKRGTSFFDCANLVMARKLKAKIASFDQFYPEDIRVG